MIKSNYLATLNNVIMQPVKVFRCGYKIVWMLLDMPWYYIIMLWYDNARETATFLHSGSIHKWFYKLAIPVDQGVNFFENDPKNDVKYLPSLIGWGILYKVSKCHKILRRSMLHCFEKDTNPFLDYIQTDYNEVFVCRETNHT